MRHIITLAVVLAALSFAGCPDPAKGKPRAEVEAPRAETEKVESRTSAFELEDDSRVDFTGAKVTGKHDGGFKDVSGTIELEGDDIESARVSIRIGMESLWTDTDKLTGHLKSPDFFDVDKFPEATFISTKIEKNNEEGATHTLTGNLDLHGVEKSISFPAKIKVGDDGVSATGEFSIDRKEFGINFPGMPDDLIRDEVLIKLSIKAGKS